MSPSCTWSSAPVTATVWATFQSAAVNVRLATEGTPSAALFEGAGIFTSATRSAGVSEAHGKCPVRPRLVVEHDAKRGRAPRLGGAEACDRRDVDARLV